ncbi:hypothetical protein JTB14_038426 [Gonioctena quinquepunctata]|nr:hypothetical protein JTB14_038426 [Gonioctena quinquepunctata]
MEKNEKDDIVFVEGGDQPESGRADNSGGKIPQRMALIRRNSLPEGGKKRKAGAQRDENPYKKKESVEALTLQEAIGKNRMQMIEMEKIIQEQPNIHKGMKEIVQKARKTTDMFQRKMILTWLENNRTEPVDKILIEADTQTEDKNEIP